MSAWLNRWIAAAAALQIATVSHAHAADPMPPGDVAAGRDYARRVCSECHSVDPVSGNGIAVIRPTDFEMIANAKAVTATSLSAFLTTPHAKMLSLIMSPDERMNVISYILSMRVR